MIGNIYIVGQIGKDESGGVELSDIIAQVQSQSSQNPERYLIHIDSPGGYCDVGHAIAEYLESLKVPVDTITTNQCASMATRIFMVGQSRTIIKPCSFLIHNPYGSVEGDADYLLSASDYFREEEDKLINVYNKVTGIEKEGLAALMKENKPMSEERALELKFATALKEQLKAVAKIKRTPDMDNKNKKTALGFINQAFKILGFEITPDSKGMMVTDESGTTLEIFSAEMIPAETVEVGYMAMIAGAPADGVFTIPDMAVVLTVSAGVITQVDPVQAKVVEPTALQKENEELKEKITALEKTIIEQTVKITEQDANAVEVLAKIEKLQTAIAAAKGTFMPPKGQSVFRKEDKPKELSLKDQIKERESQLKKDKK